MPYKLAMFGTKFMGKAHSQAWRNLGMYFHDAPEVEMTVLVGRNPEETAAAAKTYGWKESSTDWKAVMAREDIDIVDICTPGNLHYEMVLEAAKQKKILVCEKPLANTLPEAQEMLAAAKEAGVRHFLMHNYRRVPAVTHAKKMIADGRLGQLHHFRARYLQDWAMSTELHMLWRFDKKLAGSGALGDLCSHIIDLARYLCGEITEVSATMETFIKERPVSPGAAEKGKVTVDDAVVVCTRFDNGAIGTLEASRFCPGRKNLNTFEVNGSKGSLVFDLENLNNLDFFSVDDDADAQGFRTISVTNGDNHPYVGAWWPDGHIIGYEHSFTHSVYDFVMSLESGAETRPDFSDGVQNQLVLDAIEKAATTKQWQTV